MYMKTKDDMKNLRTSDATQGTINRITTAGDQKNLIAIAL